jgi:hypothetical protein
MVVLTSGSVADGAAMAETVVGITDSSSCVRRLDQMCQAVGGPDEIAATPRPEPD